MEKDGKKSLFIVVFAILLVFILFSFFDDEFGHDGHDDHDDHDGHEEHIEGFNGFGHNHGPRDVPDGVDHLSLDELLFVGDKPILEVSPHSSTSSTPGQVYGWGANTHGQIGVDPARQSRTKKVLIAPDYSGSSQIAAGWTHTLSVGNDGIVSSWGMDNKGQRGSEEVEGYGYAITDLAPIDDVKDVAASYNSTIAVDGDGDVWTMGSNYNGQIGDGTNEDRLLPYKVEGLPKIESVAAGYRFSTAVDASGKLWVWGAMCSDEEREKFDKLLATIAGNLSILGGYYDINGDHFSGRDIETDCMNENIIGIRSRAPKRILTLSGVVEASGGYGHILTRNDKGEVYAFGCNAFGQLGHGHTSNEENNPFPRKVDGLENIVQVSAGFRHSLALEDDGTLWAWGHNRRGQLGIQHFEIDDEPQEVVFPEGVTIVKAAAGHDNSFAIDGDGNVWAWGDSWSRTIFTGPHEISNWNGDIVHSPVPIKMTFEKPVIDIATGGQHVVFRID